MGISSPRLGSLFGAYLSRPTPRVAELGRVLDETAASYEELRQKHAATLEQLAWYKRWVHGRRRERIVEGEGQQHLFDLDPEGL